MVEWEEASGVEEVVGVVEVALEEADMVCHRFRMRIQTLILQGGGGYGQGRGGNTRPLQALCIETYKIRIWRWPAGRLHVWWWRRRVSVVSAPARRRRWQRLVDSAGQVGYQLYNFLLDTESAPITTCDLVALYDQH